MIFPSLIYLIGTVFLLAMIAICKLRAKLRTETLSMTIITRLYRAFQCPHPGMLDALACCPSDILTTSIGTNQGQLIIEDIIPAIGHLRKQHRLTFDTMFSPEFMALTSVSARIEISDLNASDSFFDSLTFE